MVPPFVLCNDDDDDDDEDDEDDESEKATLHPRRQRNNGKTLLYVLLHNKLFNKNTQHQHPVPSQISSLPPLASLAIDNVIFIIQYVTR